MDNLIKMMLNYQYEKMRIQYELADINDESIVSMRRNIIETIDKIAIGIDVDISTYLIENIHPLILDSEFVPGAIDVVNCLNHPIYDIYYRLETYFYNAPKSWSDSEKTTYINETIYKYNELKKSKNFWGMRKKIYTISNLDYNVKLFLERY